MRPRASFARTLLTALALVLTAPALGQLPSTEERLKILTDPESVKKKLDKERTRPPLEFFRTQVAPFDILPFVKPNHWITLSAELRANYDDYQGWIQTAPVPLLGMPHEVINRRDARLVKEQRSRVSLQLMLPRVPKEFSLELRRPDSIRADELWQASLRLIDPHQMLVLVLTKESNDPYSRWNKLQAFNPTSLERGGDPSEIERLRYYRLVLPLDPEKPLVSPHPLTWTTISHVLWDGLPPDQLSVAQQQAMLDWIHWGGQLVLVGGAGSSFELLRESFLSPYLPAEPSGENALLGSADLAALADSYPPPSAPPPESSTLSEQEFRMRTGRYAAPEPIRPALNRPLFVAGLRPTNPSASSIALGEGSPHVLGVEQRVGRGRILMLAVNPTDPALASWRGLDTLVRRVLLRRPEEPKTANPAIDVQGFHPAQFAKLTGPDLSWVRYLSRDLGAVGNRPEPYRATVERIVDSDLPESGPWSSAVRAETNPSSSTSVAEWLDSSGLPQLSRAMLEKASGIKLPSGSFVLKVIVAYLIALVPLNWLFCRYLLGRREWAWALVPLLAIGFAIGVERAAAYDVGYNSACDEIDLIELHAGYPRAHLSRFASLYSTGRTRFTISYPNDPTALALPMDTGHFLQGEDITTCVWRSYPVPALEGFQVQPRSLGMFRAEEMATLSGTVVLETDQGPRRIVNTTEFTLLDAVVVDSSGPGDRTETYLGTIEPGATVEWQAARVPEKEAERGPFDPKPLLAELRAYHEDRPENSGEVRLVAWMTKPLGGQSIEPAVDRHRGLTAVVVHLRTGPPPSPDGLTYNRLAAKDRGQDVIDMKALESVPPRVPMRNARLPRRGPFPVGPDGNPLLPPGAPPPR